MLSAPQVHTNEHGTNLYCLCCAQVSGILPTGLNHPRPLVVLNDKRYFSDGCLLDDKRMILDIEQLAEQIQVAYPHADVLVVRLRDYSIPDQMRFMAAATVFITTPGSSSHMAVFMPYGSTAVIVGGPEDESTQNLPPWVSYTSFNELDRWFPLTYVHFVRYATDIADTSSYVVKPDLNLVGARWQPYDSVERARWWNYNADVRVDMHRLEPTLDDALGLSVKTAAPDTATAKH